jgi:cyanophycinase
MPEIAPVDLPTGTLALVGGGEWTTGNDFDAELLEVAGSTDVLILPTAAAYSRPERAIATAEAYFAGLGATARAAMVLSHADANLAEHAEAVRNSPFTYLSGGSALHLLSVLKGTLVYQALLEAWRAGGVVAGSSAGAMVLADPMVDPRGGAFTVGLGLIEEMAVVPHHDPTKPGLLWRTLSLAPKGIPVAGIAEQTALIRAPDGSWRQTGVGEVIVYVDGEVASLDALPR